MKCFISMCTKCDALNKHAFRNEGVVVCSTCNESYLPDLQEEVSLNIAEETDAPAFMRYSVDVSLMINKTTQAVAALSQLLDQFEDVNKTKVINALKEIV